MSEDYVEIRGGEDSPIFILHFFGGPSDGEIINSFRPYHKTITSDGHVYEVNDLTDFLIWIDDFTKKIELHYKGKK